MFQFFLDISTLKGKGEQLKAFKKPIKGFKIFQPSVNRWGFIIPKSCLHPPRL